MVKLHTSLIAVTLATGSALASSNDYQRRSELDVQSRDFEQGAGPGFHFRCGLACAHPQSRALEDEEDLSLRDFDVVDDLEARTPPRAGFKSASRAISFGRRLSNSKHAGRFMDGVEYGQQLYDTVNSRALEDDEDLFVRDLDVVDDLEARGPPGLGIKSASKILSFGRKASKSKHTGRFLDGLDYGQQAYDAVNSRGLEDDEGLFVRDLDGVDDLEARGPPGLGIKSASRILSFGRKASKSKHTGRFLDGLDYGQQAYDAVNSRGLEDDEDLFVRDLDAEEFFGREYDFLDERDHDTIVDDLD
jgi:hypothetical protein